MTANAPAEGTGWAQRSPLHRHLPRVLAWAVPLTASRSGAGKFPGGYRTVGAAAVAGMTVGAGTGVGSAGVAADTRLPSDPTIRSSTSSAAAAAEEAAAAVVAEDMRTAAVHAAEATVLMQPQQR